MCSENETNKNKKLLKNFNFYNQEKKTKENFVQSDFLKYRLLHDVDVTYINCCFIGTLLEIISLFLNVMLPGFVYTMEYFVL